MDAGFKPATSRRVFENDLREPAPLVIGYELVDHVVRIKRFDAELVQITTKEGLAAGNPSCKA